MPIQEVLRLLIEALQEQDEEKFLRLPQEPITNARLICNAEAVCVGTASMQ